MALWFAIAALLGTLATLAYALIAYVISKRGVVFAGVAGSAATLATFSVILSAIEPRDAGAFLLGTLLILTCVVVGAPLGTMLLRFILENISPDE